MVRDNMFVELHHQRDTKPLAKSKSLLLFLVPYELMCQPLGIVPVKR
jgi:hypothetical protein